MDGLSFTFSLFRRDCKGNLNKTLGVIRSINSVSIHTKYLASMENPPVYLQLVKCDEWITAGLFRITTHISPCFFFVFLLRFLIFEMHFMAQHLRLLPLIINIVKTLLLLFTAKGSGPHHLYRSPVGMNPTRLFTRLLVNARYVSESTFVGWL